MVQVNGNMNDVGIHAMNDYLRNAILLFDYGMQSHIRLLLRSEVRMNLDYQTRKGGHIYQQPSRFFARSQYKEDS